jgi:hypothetical protein
VLNESGEFTTGTHGREGSFSAYSPFDLSFFEGCRLRRRRPLVGVATNADPVPRVRVDVSFDSGETWHAQQGGYELLNDMAGLRFTPDNPVTICSPYVATDHLWAALVDQAMRVRVTAAIASDDRVMGTAQGRFARSALPSARIVYATERLRCLSLSDGAQDDVVTFDDSAIAKMMAVESARDGEGQTMHGDVKIPWLDAGIRIGDRVAGLDGVGLPAAVSRPPRDAHPFVTAIRYENQSDEYGTTISYAYEMNRDVGQ